MPDPLLTPVEFAQSIKAKYPDYAAIPDAELAAKMLEKYPEYRARVQPAASTATPVSEHEPGTYWGGVRKSLLEQAIHATRADVDANGLPVTHAASPAIEAAMTTPIARPTGVDAIDGLLSPGSLAVLAAGGAGGLKRGAVAGAKKLPIAETLRASANAVEGVPSALRKWIPFAEGAPDHLRNVATTVKDAQLGVARGAAQYEMPRTASVVDRAPRAAQVVGEPAKMTSRERLTALVDQAVADGQLRRGVTPGRTPSIEERRAAGTLPPKEIAPPAPPVVIDELAAARAAKANSARQPGAGTLPDQKALNEAALAVRRAAYADKHAGTPAPAPAATADVLPPDGPVIKESGKMKLTLPEFKAFAKLLKGGMALPDAEAFVKYARHAGATDAQVHAAVVHRRPRL